MERHDENNEQYTKLLHFVVSEMFKLLNDWSAAEDATQEAFLHFLQNPEFLEGEPQDWILTCAKKIAYRTQYLGKKTTELWDEESLEPEQDTLGLYSVLNFENFSEHELKSPLFWGRRMLKMLVKSIGYHNQLKHNQLRRLRLLFDTASRTEAIERLKSLGDHWSCPALSIAVSRYSELVEKCLSVTLEIGPQSPDESMHWPFLKSFAKRLGFNNGSTKKRRGLLNMLLRSVNRMPPAQRHRLVSALFLNMGTEK